MTGTAVIIACLFWLAHRRWKPMLWLIGLLAIILLSTLALGGLIFGTVNVISMGFAAILLGLAVDYAVVHYQEALTHPELSIFEVRLAIAPSIFWAATTTISAFLVLNFGGLPGLGQLGSLVGVGVMLSAILMVFAYLPPLFPERMTQKNVAANPRPSVSDSRPSRYQTLVYAVTAGLVVLEALILPSGRPQMDTTADPLRPRHSLAYGALEEIKAELGQKKEPLWLLVSGRNESEVARRLDAIEPVLARAAAENVISGATTASALWPRPERQVINRATAGILASRRAEFRGAALAAGFTENALD